MADNRRLKQELDWTSPGRRKRERPRARRMKAIQDAVAESAVDGYRRMAAGNRTMSMTLNRYVGLHIFVISKNVSNEL
jgi:hypothetical protein